MLEHFSWYKIASEQFLYLLLNIPLIGVFPLTSLTDVYYLVTKSVQILQIDMIVICAHQRYTKDISG